MKAHFFWHGSALSYYERQCLASFERRGAEVYLHSFDLALDVPPGVNLMDASLLASPEEVRLYTQQGVVGSPAAFSNIFRYRVLAEEPGWWFDTDVFCLRDAEDFARLEEECGGILVGAEEPRKLNNAVIYVRDTRLAKLLEERAIRKAKDFGGSFPWGTLGPYLMTEFAQENIDRFTVLPVEAFYPISYKEADLLFDPDSSSACRAKAEGAFALHFWNEILSRHHIPKALGPCEGSFLEKLFDSTHSLAERPPSLPRDTLEALRRAYRAPTGKWELLIIKMMRLLTNQYIKIHEYFRPARSQYRDFLGGDDARRGDSR